MTKKEDVLILVAVVAILLGSGWLGHFLGYGAGYTEGSRAGARTAAQQHEACEKRLDARDLECNARVHTVIDDCFAARHDVP